MKNLFDFLWFACLEKNLIFVEKPGFTWVIEIERQIKLELSF